MRGAYFDPGHLRHEMALQQAGRTPDDLGGVAEDWTTIATLWAFLEPATAVPIARADAEAADVTHRIVVRFDERIRRGMRFVAGERVFSIRAVRDLDETGRYLVCRTREETP